MKQRTLYMASLSRSGHTAILEWLASCCVSGHDPTYSPVELGTGYSGGVLKLGTTGDQWRVWKNELTAVKGYIDKAKLILVNDERDDDLPGRISEMHKRASSLLPNVSRPILVMRDFYNQWASKYQSLSKIDDSRPEWLAHNIFWQRRALHQFPNAWTKLARECLNETTEIPGKIVVLYNLWDRNQNYRRRLCRTLGVPFDDSRRDVVPYPGSSFSGGDRHTRYRQVPEEKLWAATTEEIERLNVELFGMRPPWKEQ